MVVDLNPRASDSSFHNAVSESATSISPSEGFAASAPGPTMKSFKAVGGVHATGERDDAVVDPEALIALTAELGDVDARLRDVSSDWCVAYGRYVNRSRLKQVARELRTPPEAIGEYVATVAAAGGPAWPMATRPRSDYTKRGKARLETATALPRLRIRLRPRSA